MEPRHLIVNADDFGLSNGINRGILHAHEHGIVTSTSLMVRAPAAESAAAGVRRFPALSVGLHVDFGEWAFRGGKWVQLYAVVPLDDDAAIRQELERQLRRFRQLIGGMPTHVDSHQHVHLREPARSALLELGSWLGVPVRHAAPVAYCGAFYGQTAEGLPLPDKITPEALVRVFAALQPGVTELACHPGFGEGLDTMYSAEREIELQTLCDPLVNAAVREAGILLSSFFDVAPKHAPPRTGRALGS